MKLFFLGLAASALAFFFKELFRERKLRRQRLWRASYVLISASEEVQFYSCKLKQLVEQIDSDLVNLGSGTLTVPSYSFYPEFLAGLRANLTERRLIRSALFAALGNCHFELSHLAQRLEENKARLHTTDFSKGDALQLYVANWKGLQELARQNIATFESVSVELRLEAKRIQAVARNYEPWSDNNMEELIASQDVGDGRS